MSNIIDITSGERISGVQLLSDSRRELISNHLYPFVRWAMPLVEADEAIMNWHIGRICEYLEAMTNGEIRDLLINIPPGCMKSLNVCVFWNAWAWIKRPGLKFLFTSYRGDLALRDANKTRKLIRHPVYQANFGDSFNITLDQAHRYENDKSGMRFSTSVNGIMGEGGHFVVMDDPHNVEQAESDDVRDDTVRKLRLALPSRVRSPRGGTVTIMQRLHSRDWAGHLIESKKDLVHLMLPMKFEAKRASKAYTLPSGRVLPGDDRTTEGELLFPGLWQKDRVEDLITELGDYGEAGQLQQRPVPRAGGIFKRAWFNNYIEPEELPQMIAIVRGWDLAGSDRKNSPYTAGVKLAMDAQKRIYIWHAMREKYDVSEVPGLIKGTTKSDGFNVYVDIPQDPGQAGKEQVRSYRTLLTGYMLHWSPESGSKIQRAETFAPECRGNNVWIVRGDWNEPYLDEICAFPTGQYADWTDATSRAYGRLVQVAGMIGDATAGGELIEG